MGQQIKILFRRHAKRRMKLYNIKREDIEIILLNEAQAFGRNDGKYEAIEPKIKNRYGYPLKVVFTKEMDQYIVITAYPLKRGVK